MGRNTRVWAVGVVAVVTFELPAPGQAFQYPMEPLMGLATAWDDPGNGVDEAVALDDAITWLTHDIAEPGVLHYGERIYHFGNGDYLHTVGFPHVWSGAEVYIAAA